MAAAATLAVSFQKHATWRENRPRLRENFHGLAIPIPEMLRFRDFWKEPTEPIIAIHNILATQGSCVDLHINIHTQLCTDNLGPLTMNAAA